MSRWVPSCWLAGAVLLMLLMTQPAAARPPGVPSEPGWGPAQPLALDSRPSLQSEAALALAGSHTLLGWSDTRDNASGLYTVFWEEEVMGEERSAAVQRPTFETQMAQMPAVVVESSGRAFAVYADEVQIYLLRYDPEIGRWSAPVQVTRGLEAWPAVAGAPPRATDGAGDLVVVWEDDRNSGSEPSLGSDIYAAVCDGATLVCADPNVRVNDDETHGAHGNQRRPQVSRRGSQVAVVWEDPREAGLEAPQIYAAFSEDGGRTWGANVRVSEPGPEGNDSAAHPGVAHAADGTLFATWEQRTGGSTAPADIYAARKQGSGWETPQRVDRAPARTRALAPAVAAGDAGVFVVWQDHRSGSYNSDLYSARFDGAGWQERPVSTAAGRQAQPALAASGQRVRAVWQDTRQGEPDLFTATWLGDGWSEATQVNTDAGRSPVQMAPVLASAGGVTYAVFLDSRSGYNELWLSTLPWQTTTWTEPVPLPTWARAGAQLTLFSGWLAMGAQIAVDETGQLHAVWSANLWPYGIQIYYSVYQEGRWRAPVRLSGEDDDGRARYAPAIASRDGVLAVAWSEFDAAGDVQLYAQWNTGDGWSDPSPLLAARLAEAWSVPSSIALVDRTAVVVWDETDADGRGRILAARRALEGGVGWTFTQVSPPVGSDWCAQHSPQLRADSDGRLHVVWSGCALRNPPDEWPHDAQIFYATSQDGGATFSQPVGVGLTVAPEDEEHHNQVASLPTLATGPGGTAQVLYPSRSEGVWSFYVAQIENGTVAAVQRLGEPTASWTPAGPFNGRYFGSDSAGAIAYNGLLDRYIAVFPDSRNQRTPVLYATHTGDSKVTLPHGIYLPTVLQ